MSHKGCNKCDNAKFKRSCNVTETYFDRMLDEQSMFETRCSICKRDVRTGSWEHDLGKRLRKKWRSPDFAERRKRRAIFGALEVFLQTINPTGNTFIRTDQLDGETDWKYRPLARTVGSPPRFFPPPSQGRVLLRLPKPHRHLGGGQPGFRAFSYGIFAASQSSPHHRNQPTK